MMQNKKMGVVTLQTVFGFFLPYLIQVFSNVNKGMTWKQAIAGAVTALFAAYASLTDTNKA